MNEENGALFAEERRAKISELLATEKRVLVKDLAERFQISIDSIRRDLTIMEQKGLLKKTHGGAIPAMKVRQAPPPPEIRYGEGTAQGRAIAKIAVSYIREKDTVFIGSGSLSYLIVKELPTNMPLTIITNSMAVAEALRSREGIDTYLIGGRVKPSGNMTDVMANEMARQFRYDVCFVTGGGISENGISTATPEVAAFGRAVTSVSRRCIGLATHQTIGNDGFAKAGPIDVLDVLITDEETDQEVLEKIQALGVKVVVAQGENDNL
jgi:DeoR/GlpR family transcriptional regulator of sugar metabolism